MNESSPAHAKWDCVYHAVWIPKYGRKATCGQMRREVAEILRIWVEREGGVGIAGDDACPDRIRICL